MPHNLEEFPTLLGTDTLAVYKEQLKALMRSRGKSVNDLYMPNATELPAISRSIAYDLLGDRRETFHVDVLRRVAALLNVSLADFTEAGCTKLDPVSRVNKAKVQILRGLYNGSIPLRVETPEGMAINNVPEWVSSDSYNDPVFKNLNLNKMELKELWYSLCQDGTLGIPPSCPDRIGYMPPQAKEVSEWASCLYDFEGLCTNSFTRSPSNVRDQASCFLQRVADAAENCKMVPIDFLDCLSLAYASFWLNNRIMTNVAFEFSRSYRHVLMYSFVGPRAVATEEGFAEYSLPAFQEIIRHLSTWNDLLRQLPAVGTAINVDTDTVTMNLLNSVVIERYRHASSLLALINKVPESPTP